MDSEAELNEEAPRGASPFKKPLLVGKIGKLPKKLPQTKTQEIESTSNDLPIEELPEIPKNNDLKTPPYEIPLWSSLPEGSQNYILEVLKNGAIIETIDLMTKEFWVFGRLGNCDVCMQHPTISRYHAVLQFRNDNEEMKGFYIYDLESTHGTFLNKNRVRPRSYQRVKVGHMLKLGCSTRTYILNGPPEDAEAESSLSITELKQKRLEELLERQQQEEESRRRDEEKGIDWGMGEDAEEDPDLSENPYAQTNNEELYIENPKKALRGFFEREGLELEYDCQEQGLGQFLCKVELPLDDETGRPIYAEIFHKGKKKEAVVQCALEACRILDRHGVLRQATHESKRRKPKNWEENDFYDSDDDTFLDRTGSIEKKREMRMSHKVGQKAETYESLMEKEKNLNFSIKNLENELNKSIKIYEESERKKNSEETDSLDSFMNELNQSKPTKKNINKLKSELIKLKSEHDNLIKLINIAKPASLPPLVPQYQNELKKDDEDNKEKKVKVMPVFGKRKKIKLQLPDKKIEEQITDDDDDDDEETIQEEIKPPEQLKESDDEKRKKKNQRRIQQKQEKAKVEKRKGYEEDSHKEDYNMWVPPSGQTGDGRTSLNDKLGY